MNDEFRDRLFSVISVYIQGDELEAAKMQTSVRDVPQTDIAKANAVQKSVGVKKPQEVAPDDNSRKPTFRL